MCLREFSIWLVLWANIRSVLENVAHALRIMCILSMDRLSVCVVGSTRCMMRSPGER